jgi:hypothetical protein
VSTKTYIQSLACRVDVPNGITPKKINKNWRFYRIYPCLVSRIFFFWRGVSIYFDNLEPKGET